MSHWGNTIMQHWRIIRTVLVIAVLIAAVAAGVLQGERSADGADTDPVETPTTTPQPTTETDEWDSSEIDCDHAHGADLAACGDMVYTDTPER